MTRAIPMTDAELDNLARSLDDLDLVTGPLVRRLLATVAAERARTVEAQAAGLSLLLVLEFARTAANGRALSAIRTQAGDMLLVDDTLATAGAILRQRAA